MFNKRKKPKQTAFKKIDSTVQHIRSFSVRLANSVTALTTMPYLNNLGNKGTNGCWEREGERKLLASVGGRKKVRPLSVVKPHKLTYLVVYIQSQHTALKNQYYST